MTVGIVRSEVRIGFLTTIGSISYELFSRLDPRQIVATLLFGLRRRLLARGLPLHRLGDVRRARAFDFAGTGQLAAAPGHGPVRRPVPPTGQGRPLARYRGGEPQRQRSQLRKRPAPWWRAGPLFLSDRYANRRIALSDAATAPLCQHRVRRPASTDY